MLIAIFEVRVIKIRIIETKDFDWIVGFAIKVHNLDSDLTTGLLFFLNYSSLPSKTFI